MVQSYLYRSPASDSDDPCIEYKAKGSNDGESHRSSRRNDSFRSTSGTTPENAVKKRTPKSSNRKKLNEQNRFLCDKCPYTTMYRDLGRHMKKHENVRFPCNICNMPFMSIGFLNKHKESTHGIERTACNDPKIYKCKECDYTTRYNSDINRHKRRHKNAVESCRFCRRPFYNVGNLAVHMKREHEQSERKNSVKDSRCRKRQKLSRRCKENRGRYITETTQSDQNENYSSDGTESITDISYQRVKKRRTENTCLDTDVDDTCNELDCNDGATEDESNRNKVKNKVENKDIGCALKGQRNTCCFSDNSESDDDIDKTAKSKGNKQQKEEEDEDEKRTRNCLHNENNDDEYFETEQFPIQNVSNGANGLDIDLIKILNCAFCEFKARTIKELHIHLDDHDKDINDPECTDKGADSANSYISLIDNTSLSKTSVIVDNEKNFFMETVREMADEEISLLGTMDWNDKEIIVVDDAQSKCSADTQPDRYSGESADVLNMFVKCMPNIESGKREEFKMRPFACSKCFFTTGNLEHLKIHAEAHLYDTIRTAHCVQRRDLSHGTVTQLPENRNDDDTEIVPRGIPFGLEREIRDKTDIASVDNQTKHDVVNDRADCYTVRQSVFQKDSQYVDSEDNNLIGRLSRKDFKKNRKCYTEYSTDGVTTFECLICEIDKYFDSKEAIKEHFLIKHKKLREKICETCSHCSKPFP